MHGPLANDPRQGWIDRFRLALIDPRTSALHYGVALAAVGLMAMLAWGLYP